MADAAAPHAKLRRLLVRLWRQLQPRRRRQFIAIMALVVLASFAEVASPGPCCPFSANRARAGDAIVARRALDATLGRDHYQPYRVHVMHNSSELIGAITGEVADTVQVLNLLLTLLSSGVLLVFITTALLDGTQPVYYELYRKADRSLRRALGTMGTWRHGRFT